MKSNLPLPTFDLRLVPSFVAVAEELHFGRAADRLQLAQPALSRQISKLEDQLGARLLIRSSREVTLTPAGEFFLAAAQEIMQRAVHARAALREERGELVVHVGDGMNPLVTHAITSFSTAHPQVRVRLIEGGLSEATAAVLAGTADVGVDVPEGVAPGLSYLPVDRQPIGLVCARGHRLAAAGSAQWSDLDGETLIFAPPGVADGHNAFVRAQLHGFGVIFTETEGQLSKGPLMSAHIAAGQGQMICGEYVFTPRPDGVAWLPLTPTVLLELGIIWDEQLTTPAVSRFVRWLAGLHLPAAGPSDVVPSPTED